VSKNAIPPVALGSVFVAEIAAKAIVEHYGGTPSSLDVALAVGGGLVLVVVLIWLAKRFG
jgi:hypothetical protein